MTCAHAHSDPSLDPSLDPSDCGWLDDLEASRADRPDPLSILLTVAIREGRADLYCLARLCERQVAGDDRPLRIIVARLARAMGIQPRTAAAQLRASPDLAYIPRHYGDHGSLICMAADGPGFRRQSALPGLAVDNPVDNPHSMDVAGCARPHPAHVRALASGGQSPEEMIEEPKLIPLTGGAGGAAPRRGMEESVPVLAGDPGPELRAVAAMIATSGETWATTEGAAVDVDGMAVTLASLSSWLAPHSGDASEATTTAVAVLDRGLRTAPDWYRPGVGSPQGAPWRPAAGWRWCPLLLRDPVRYGLRKTFLTAQANGWGRLPKGPVRDACELTGRQRAILRAALAPGR